MKVIGSELLVNVCIYKVCSQYGNDQTAQVYGGIYFLMPELPEKLF
jgi:hypothetical protein